MGLFDRILEFLFRPRQGPAGVRDRGRPRNAAGGPGASSFHLHWKIDTGSPVVAMEATLEVADPPAVADLYFWAIQATFSSASRAHGGAHLGLQWNPRFPGSTAVNWGGYLEQDLGGTVLTGTPSPLPSTPADPNTRDYPWRAHRPYRLRIEPGSTPGQWRGLVTDVIAGATSEVRELVCEGDRLTSLTMWSEVFADCGAPSVAVRWTGMRIERSDGTTEGVSTVETNYQDYSRGGCTNTNSAVDGDGFVQRTTTERLSANRTVLRV